MPKPRWAPTPSSVGAILSVIELLEIDIQELESAIRDKKDRAAVSTAANAIKVAHATLKPLFAGKRFNRAMANYRRTL